MLNDLQPLFLTFELAAITTLILVVLGIPLAYWIAFSKSKLKYIVEPLVSMPLVLPPTVLGFYILLAFSPKYFLGHYLESTFDIRIAFSFVGLVIGSVFFSLPFMVNPIKSGFENFPVSLIEASYVLGKSKWETLFKVILPNIKPSLLSGLVMSFAHTMGEFGVVLMIGGSIPGETKVASIAVYEQVESLNYASANFYSLVLFASAFVILFSFYLMNRKTVRII